MKKICLLPLAVFAIGALAGCGNNGGGGSGATTIYVNSGYGKGFQTRLQAYASLFMKDHPDINVVVSQITGSYSGVRKQTNSDLEANNDTWGDLVQCYPDHIQDYKMKYRKAVNVEQFIESEDPEIGMSAEEIANFTGAAQETFNTEFSFSGKFVLPYSASTEALYYNPVLLNLTIPGVNNGERISKEYMNSLTWEELFDNLCPKLVAYNDSLPAEKKFYNTSGATHAVVAYDSDDNAFITLAEQYGYGYTSLDEDGNPHLLFDENEPGNKSKEMQALLKKWNGYYAKNYLITKGTNNDSFCSSLLADNSLLMSIGSTGGISYLYTGIGGAYDAEVARLPQAAGQTTKLINQGGSWCILAHNSANDKERQLAAWKFYKFISSQDMCTAWCSDTGYAPILKSVYGTEEWAELINEEGKEGEELLKAKNAKYAGTVQENLFVNVVFQGSSSSRDYVGGLFKEVLMKANPTDNDIKTLFATAVNNIRNDM